MSEGTTSTLAGAAGGGLVGGAKTTLKWLGITVLGGAALGVLAAAGGLGVIFGGVAAVAGSGLFWGAIGGAVLGGLLFGVSWPYVAAGGAVVGGVKGGARAQDRAADQRAMAMEMQMSAPAQNVGYPAQGSQYNMAGGTIQAAGLQRDGVVANDMGRARA